MGRPGLISPPAARRTVHVPPVTLTREQSRQVDRLAIEKYGISGLVLMENAGRGVADKICQLAADPKDAGQIVICCGKGNNAGDGFVIARHLHLRGFDVRVLLWAKPDELGGDAETNFRILQNIGLPVELLSVQPLGGKHDTNRLDKLLDGAACIVDALLGTGARGEPRPPLDEVIDRINAAEAPVLAVDLPSGLDCDSGQPAMHTIRATLTCTFFSAKPGFFAPGAKSYTGELHILDIGLPPDLVEQVPRGE
jgi:NAD(P)H-hydrate epimerase